MTSSGASGSRGDDGRGFDSTFTGHNVSTGLYIHTLVVRFTIFLLFRFTIHGSKKMMMMIIIIIIIIIIILKKLDYFFVTH